MRLICPICGGAASLEAWENDALVRQFEGVLVSLPGPVAKRVKDYLAMFRPRGTRSRGLAWKAALARISTLRDLVAAGHVQWKKKPARPCPPAIWADAMERMIHQAKVDLPLTSHGYLTAIAYGLADDADRATEVSRNAAERSGSFPGKGREGSLAPVEVISKDELRKIRESSRIKKRGHGDDKPQ